MPREAIAIESRRIELRLEQAQAQTLRSMGRELAASQAWWGSEEVAPQKSVIDVAPLGDGCYGVTFRDVVGVLNLGELQIQVRPKISGKHFSHLIQHCSIAPRFAESATAVDESDDYMSLLARWCVAEAEALLRRGLRPDYRETREELTEVCGRLDVLATCLAVQTGRAVAHCEFEEFSDDSSLNRVVKAACQLVSVTADIAPGIRKRARSVALRMGRVGHLQHGDRLTHVTRLTKGYGRVFPLARLILQGGGVSSRIGSLSGRSFLLRTPELIEDGLRNILSKRLDSFDVRKRRLHLGKSGVSINPDLVFDGGLAVGDVKYRYFSDDWDRSSLYQAVAFAAGFKSKRCGVFGFIGDPKQKTPSEVPLGDVMARSFAWNASAEVSPASSETSLCTAVDSWLSNARIARQGA